MVLRPVEGCEKRREGRERGSEKEAHDATAWRIRRAAAAIHWPAAMTRSATAWARDS